MYSKDTGKDQMLMTMELEFIGEDNVPSASYTYVVTGAYDNFGGKVSIGGGRVSEQNQHQGLRRR